jgi:hypothetical protein
LVPVEEGASLSPGEVGGPLVLAAWWLWCRHCWWWTTGHSTVRLGGAVSPAGNGGSLASRATLQLGGSIGGVGGNRRVVLPRGWERRSRGQRWRAARRSASWLGGGVTPAGRGWRPARCSASRLGSGGAGGGVRGRRASQPRGWMTASLLLAVGGGARRAVRPRGWAAVALRPAVEGGAPFGFVAGRWRDSCLPRVAPGALLGLEAGWRRRWRRQRRTVRRSASWLGGGVPPAGRGWRPARCSASRLDGGGADTGGGGRRAVQPRGCTAASFPLAGLRGCHSDDRSGSGTPAQDHFRTLTFF